MFSWALYARVRLLRCNPASARCYATGPCAYSLSESRASLFVYSHFRVYALPHLWHPSPTVMVTCHFAITFTDYWVTQLHRHSRALAAFTYTSWLWINMLLHGLSPLSLPISPCRFGLALCTCTAHYLLTLYLVFHYFVCRWSPRSYCHLSYITLLPTSLLGW